MSSVVKDKLILETKSRHGILSVAAESLVTPSGAHSLWRYSLHENASATFVSLNALEITNAFSNNRFIRIWLPLERDFKFVGLDERTIYMVLDMLVKIYSHSSCSGVSETISAWNRAVRDIISDEPLTKLQPKAIPYGKTLRNSILRHSQLTDCRIPIKEFSVIADYQGNRPIPPYLLDFICIRGLSEKPNFNDLRIICDLSNIKRTLPEPDTDGIPSLNKFRSMVSSRVPWHFSVRNVSKKVAEVSYRKLPDSFRSSWSASSTSSYDYGRAAGGKFADMKSNVLEFIHMEIDDFCDRPDCHIYDILGNIFLKSEDYAEGLPIWACCYKSIINDPDGPVDSRFGLFGLTWALRDLRDRGIVVSISNEYGTTMMSTDPHPILDVDREQYLPTRVECLAEGGWKFRVITVTAYSMALIGELTRKFLDISLHSEETVKIGMTSRVKLYDFLTKIGGKGSADWVDGKEPKFNPTPGNATSVDLSNATDAPPVEIVRDITDGTLDWICKDSHSSLRSMVDLCLTRRIFVMPDGDIEIDHRSGQMMGEGLSGFFLNCASVLVKTLAPSVFDFFPIFKTRLFDNREIDDFIVSNIESIQNFLDTVNVSPNRLGSPSGDDLVNFSLGNLSNPYRFIYRILGFIPSENTWYCSERYALFTEECAIRTHDSNGWKFVDSVKPRVFSEPISDEFGESTASKISLLSSYMRYVKSPLKRSFASSFSDELLNNSPGWKRTIERQSVPVGLPPFLGGVNHVDGLTMNYHVGLPMEDLKVLIGLGKLKPIDALFLIMDTPTGIDDEKFNTFTSEVRTILNAYRNSENLDDQESIIDSKIFISQMDGEKFWDYQKRLETFKKDSGLMSVFDFVSRVAFGFTLKDSLLHNLELTGKMSSYRKTNFRLNKLREMFITVTEEEVMSEISNVSIHQIRSRILDRGKSLLIFPDHLRSLLGLASLPSMDVSLVDSHQ